jgi:hypothetical protein
MPTPESELFLKKKPTVPPTFQGVDFNDLQALRNAQDAIIREQWVKQMMARLVRDELGKCYVQHGVNHLEKCGVYRDRYIQLLKENREKGYRGQMLNYDPGVTGPALPADKQIASDYPTVQQAKGTKGSDFKKGTTSGAGGDTLY